MKNLQLSQVKGDSFNMVSIVEECIEVNPSDCKGMEEKLNSLLAELEGLNEALYFKKEKLGHETSTEDEQKHANLATDIQAKLKRVQLSPLGDSKSILEKNKQILELKTMQKLLRYSIELDENAEKVLSTLLHSDVPEDWNFLCLLLNYSLKYNKRAKHETLQVYAKKIEEKLKETFRNNIKSKNTPILKACFEALSQMEKHNLIYEIYVHNFSLINEPLNVYPPNPPKINVNCFMNRDETFTELINRILEICHETNEYDYIVFGNTVEYNEYLYDKIYRVLVYKGLEFYLGIRDPVLFLLCLEHAYDSVSRFNKVIRSFSTKMNPDTYKGEAFAQYLYKAIEVEKDGFDLLFGVMVNGEVATKKYILCGYAVVHQDKMVKAFELLLLYVDTMVKRANKMYSEEETNEILRYMFRKMNILIDKLILEAEEKMALIDGLSRIYSLTKKYLGNKFVIVDDFAKKLGESIQEAFDFKINYINLTIKRKINALYFEHKSDYKRLLTFIKTSIKEGETLQGRNFNVYTDRILAYAFKRLHKHILTILYSKEQTKNLVHAIDEIQGFVLFINRTAMAHHYNYLRNICKLISVPKEKFMDEYSDLENLLTDKDIKALIKCRKDKEEIQTMIYKKAE